MVILWVGLAIASFILANPFTITAGVLFSIGAIRSTLRLAGVCNQRAPLPQLFLSTALAQVTPLNTQCPQNYTVIPTDDGIDSHHWRLRLVAQATRSIVMTNVYVGGEAFQEFLTAVQIQMRAHPELRTAILSGPAFLTKENRRSIAALRQEFGPDRFIYKISPELMPYVSPTTHRFSLLSNHTKALVIDAGAYFMMGGSGIVNLWSKNDGLQTPEHSEKYGLFGPVSQIQAFRDTDVVVHAPEPNGIGTRLHTQILQLLAWYGAKISEIHLLLDSRPSVIAPGLTEEKPNNKLSLYVTNPDELNPYLEKVIEEIDGAQEEIVIDHMYFYPDKRIIKALQNAADRGCKIIIVTNQIHKKGPNAHISYAGMNKHHWQLLLQRKPNPNIEVWVYKIPKTTMHKKVIIIDGKASCVGSANMGTKSERSDYEMNLVIESSTCAAKLRRGVDIDIQHSRAITTAEIKGENCLEKIVRIFATHAFVPIL
ncbi:MAG: hypothetical protein RL235_994 [Chlamydiota bacterium]